MAAITTYTGTLPNKSQTPEQFNANVTAFLAYIAGLGPEINTAIAEILVGASVTVWAAGVYNPPTIVAGSDGNRYACIVTTASGDNPVGSVTGCWVQLTFDANELFPPISATVPIEGDIRGFDATVSGNVVTFQPGACMDSTGNVKLATSVAATVTIPSTTNLDSNIYVVRVAADSTISFRSYSTATDPSSDATINAWRRISYAKNNAAGATMPFRQTGGRIDWLVSTNRPVLTPTLTASYASYNIDAVLPTGLYLTATIVANSTQTIYASLDGTTDIVPGVYPTMSVTPSSVYLKYNSGTVAVHIDSVTLRR